MLADKDSIVTIPFRAFLSNGTAPDTGLSNDSMRASANGAAQFTCTNKVSAVSAGAGQYVQVLTASETSVLGSLAVWYDQGDFPQHIATVEVVNSNPYSSLSAIAAKDYSSTVTFGVGAIKAATYSGVTVGVNNIAAGTYSGATVGINNIAAGAYSGVTIDGVTRVNSSVTIANAEYSAVTVRASVLSGHTPQTGDNFARLGAPAGASVSADVAAVKVDTAAVKVKTDQMVYTTANRLDATINSAVTLAGGTYSDVTIGGVTRVNSSVTIANATYSAVTVQVNGGTVTAATSVTNPVTAGTVTDKTGYGLAAGTYSGVTVGVNNVAAGSYSGVTIAGVTSGVTLLNGAYSGVTISGVNSGVTVLAGGIAATSFAAGAVDAAALSTDAEDSIADALLARNVAGGSSTGRLVKEALYALRNKVAIDGSIVTVYQVNDTTSAWTASVATVSANSGVIQVIDPG